MIARTAILALASGLLSLAPLSSTALPPQMHPIYGGANGTAFTRSCGNGKVLSGLRFREGMLVDAIGILCRPVLASGALGPESSVGTLVGGSGGTSGSLSCPSGMVVNGTVVWHGTYVDRVAVDCRDWNAVARTFGGSVGSGSGAAGSVFGKTSSKSMCEAPSQPANGIRGRAHSLIDAIGLICDEP